ncbi:MAG: sigma-70 family RNA polymerase sigma factor [Planctomycetota bacterium]
MNSLPLTRQSLLLALRDRSHGAWQEFLEIYEIAIYASCRRRGLQDADASDVTQEVLAAVDRRVASLDGDGSRGGDSFEGSFRAWLFRVARNIAVDRLIERSRRAAASGDTRVSELLHEVPMSTESEEEAFRVEYQRALMTWAADQVRPSYSEASWRSFWLTAIEGQAPADVARQLGVSVGSVYTAKCRIFARIRSVMDNLDDDARSAAEEFAERPQDPGSETDRQSPRQVP